MCRLFAEGNLLVLCVLAGCAAQSPKPFIKEVTLGGVHAVSIDIKQRMVFERDIPGGTGNPTSTIVCPEPSPDALSATAASLNLSVSGAEKLIQQIGASGQTGETSAMVGLRTQSIQLLRDQLTHLCLGYMNNALTAGNYALLLRREQRLTLGILAVEQLTGAAVAQTSIVNSPSLKSENGTGKSTDDASKKPPAPNSSGANSGTKNSDGKNSNSQSGGANSNSTSNGNSNSTTRLQQPRSSTATAGEFIKVVDTTNAAASKSKNSQSSPTAKSNSDASPGNDGTSSQGNATDDKTTNKSAAKDIAALAPAVQGIVHDVLTTGFEEEECLAVMALDGSTGADGKPVTIGEIVRIYCDNILQIGVQKTDVQLQTSRDANTLSPTPPTSTGSNASTASKSKSSSSNLNPFPQSDSASESANEGKRKGLAHEQLGFAALQSFNYQDAAKEFRAADAAYPTLGNASELSSLLQSLDNSPPPAQECSTIQTISDRFRWRIPGMTKIALHGKYDALNCAKSYGQIKF